MKVKPPRKSAAKRGYNRRWAKAARRFLDKHPLCAHREINQDICKTAARAVDHIERHGGNKRKFWDERNWQGLCIPCHSRKTATEQLAGDDARGVDEHGIPRDPDHHWHA